jgi:hypothetical protein
LTDQVAVDVVCQEFARTLSRHLYSIICDRPQGEYTPTDIDEPAALKSTRRGISLNAMIKVVPHIDSPGGVDRDARSLAEREFHKCQIRTSEWCDDFHHSCEYAQEEKKQPSDDKRLSN